MHPLASLFAICVLSVFGVLIVVALTINDERGRIRGPLAMFGIGLTCLVLAMAGGCEERDDDSEPCEVDADCAPECDAPTFGAFDECISRAALVCGDEVVDGEHVCVARD